MLKYSLFLTGVLLCMFGVAKAQPGIKVTYQMTFVESESSSTLVKAFKAENMPFLIEDSQAVLEADPGQSFFSFGFSKYANTRKDSTVFSILVGNPTWQDSSTAYNIVKNQPGFPEGYIKLLSLQEHPGSLTPWLIQEEHKMIGDYLCFKATRMKIRGPKNNIAHPIVAWFCPELPYAFGPLEYGGLPGLILELQTVNVLFGARKVSIVDQVKLPPLPPLPRIKDGQQGAVTAEGLKEQYR